MRFQFLSNNSKTLPQKRSFKYQGFKRWHCLVDMKFVSKHNKLPISIFFE